MKCKCSFVAGTGRNATNEHPFTGKGKVETVVFVSHTRLSATTEHLGY